MPLQNAPPAAPATSTITTASGRGQPPSAIPSAPAAIAPTTNWPSAPMFHSAPRKATDIASPVNTSGIVLTSVSVAASQLPNAPSHSAAKTASGEAPSANRISAMIAAASASAATGLASRASITARR